MWKPTSSSFRIKKTCYGIHSQNRAERGIPRFRVFLNSRDNRLSIRRVFFFYRRGLRAPAVLMIRQSHQRFLEQTPRQRGRHAGKIGCGGLFGTTGRILIREQRHEFERDGYDTLGRFHSAKYRRRGNHERDHNAKIGDEPARNRRTRTLFRRFEFQRLFRIGRIQRLDPIRICKRRVNYCRNVLQSGIRIYVRLSGENTCRDSGGDDFAHRNTPQGGCECERKRTDQRKFMKETLRKHEQLPFGSRNRSVS